MSDRQETIADIIAEMRRRSDEAYKGSFNYPECQENQIEYDEANEWADRLEAAHKRERGDCAKLREALNVILGKFFENGYGQNRAELDDNDKQMILAALAAPARNCDVYNNESCRMAYHLHGDGLMTMQAFADWLFATATEKEGGANG